MTTSDHPFAASAAAANGSQPPSQARLALDNLLRRELRVSDPNDAKAVATALMERYKNDPRTRAIQSEAQGLPFSTAPLATTPLAAVSTTSDGEFSQASEDVERNLQELTTNSLLTQVLPELGGWASAIRNLMQEGINSARFALDVKQRDKTFGIRRSLGDYARMARLVGALSPSVNVIYRKLAQSLDAISSVLLVKMGEALAQGSFSGGQFIMQAPYGELQARRDAVINALRNLVGCTTQILDPDDWPRGLDAYGELYQQLEKQGQSDLRALLDENELSRIMDSLIQRAAHGHADGLRALGATAQLDLQRFVRLFFLGKGVVDPESPQLTTFLKAIKLFADAFASSGGINLLHVARPPILFYGLYGSSGTSESGAILTRLITYRGQLATQLDCLASCCEQDPKKIRSLVVLDKVLYDLDRAIDLRSLGTDGFGKAERRAAAYGYVIGVVLRKPLAPGPTGFNEIPSLPANNFLGKPSSGDTDPKGELYELLGKVQSDLNVTPAKDLDPSTNLSEFLSNTPSAPFDSIPDIESASRKVIDNAERIHTLEAAELNRTISNNDEIELERWHRIIRYLQPTHHEVCLQREMESRWKQLVLALSSGCHGNDIFSDLSTIMTEACARVSIDECPSPELRLPIHTQTAWDMSLTGSSTMGAGRNGP